jgi:hypothetical protein
MNFRPGCLVIVAAFVALAIPGIANAEAYSGLLKQGYTVSKLGQGKSGSLGWVLSKSGKKFFCRLNASLAIVSSKQIRAIG